MPLTAGAAARAAQRLALHAGRELPWAVCVGPGRVQVSKHACSFSGGCGLSGRRMLMPTAAGCSGAWAALEVSCRYPLLHRVKSQPCLVPPAQSCLAGEMFPVPRTRSAGRCCTTRSLLSRTSWYRGLLLRAHSDSGGWSLVGWLVGCRDFLFVLFRRWFCLVCGLFVCRFGFACVGFSAPGGFAVPLG